MSAMDDAMNKLASAVEAAKTKAVDDFKATLPPATDAQAVADTQESEDAAKVSAFADQIAPPA